MQYVLLRLARRTSQERDNLHRRSHLAAASTSIGVIAFAGGLTAAGVASDVVDIFNVDTYEWTAGNLVSPRLGLAGAAAGAWLVFAGGYSTNGDGGDNAEVCPLSF